MLSQVAVLHYEVKWAGGAITWEPTWNLTNCQQLVDAFETEWRRQYDEGPAPRAKPRAKPAAAEAKEFADSEAEAVADNNAAFCFPVICLFPFHTDVWPALQGDPGGSG